jgi:dTDP-4-amino-4,6-dideoxygalactose transaminase
MNWDIQLFKLNFDEKEPAAVSAVVNNGWLSMGEKILEFESSFSDLLGEGVLCSGVTNCTAALHLALLALGVDREDEVIIPALTFVADANVVNIVGAIPVIADCTSIDDWNMSVESIDAKITERTKAVIVVHYAGYPCKDIGEIAELCKERGIGLIEDVAHAPGASFDGKACGTWGDIGCFSFFSNKNLSIGEGGMVSTCSEDLSKKIRYLRSHGMTSLTLDRHKGRSITYDVAHPGLNYRMDEMRAALGSVQLDKLLEGNRNRKELTERYRANLKNSSIEMPFSDQPTGSLSAYHILPVLLPVHIDRVTVINALKEKRIQSSIHYPPFWNFTAYEGQFSPKQAPIVAQICERQLTLPLFPTMTKAEVDQVTTVLLQAVG